MKPAALRRLAGGLLLAAALVQPAAAAPERSGALKPMPAPAARRDTPVTARPAARVARDGGLEQRLAAISREARGVLGVSVRHLSSGRTAAVRPNERFPMASTYKFPLAVAVLRGVDRGEIRLAERIRLRPSDMNASVSVLTDRFPAGGVSVSVHDLLAEMLKTSDNTACDVLMQRAGGPRAVTAEMGALGIRDLRIDRDETAMGNDWFGLKDVRPDSTWTVARMRKARADVRPTARAYAAREFGRDPRDQGSPAAMTELLVRVWTGHALSPAMTDTLKILLARCVTGENRLRAGLPKPVKLAHRTGTAGTWNDHTWAVNDVGVFRLPGGGGEVAISVFVKDVRGPVREAERTIERVARAVFDEWNAPD